MSSVHFHSHLIPHFGSSQPLNLEAFLLVFILSVIFTLCLSPGGLAWALSKTWFSPQGKTAIPGPSGLPILGLVLDFTSSLTHRVLDHLSRSYKARKLMAFSIGFTRFIISSDPETAKEMLNSSAFADRPIKESAYELLFHKAMGFAPYGGYWRNLRRMASTHLFSPKKIESFSVFRNNIGLQMVIDIKRMMQVDGSVEVRKVLHFGSLNNVMMSVFGKAYDFSSEEGRELESLVKEGYQLLGLFNWSDHFPLLGWLDLQGVRKRCQRLADRVNVFVANIVHEHRIVRAQISEKRRNDDNGDFVDLLLDLDGEHKLTDSDTIAVLWEMIFRGTDTVAILLEWILARLVLHPDIQSKAQAEMDTVLGLGQAVSDSDLPNLPYLRAIVKETLRMHPPGPLLSWARLAIHDTHIGQHFVPSGTTAMVNMWAITHDDQVWSDPYEFKPERFIHEDVLIMGSDLRLAPFGSGRRVCPGKAMGLATVELWLAQLLQNFRWMPHEKCDVDLSECLKLSMEMKQSLVCKAIPRARSRASWCFCV